MEGLGLAPLPRETPPVGPGSAVPSPLQSSCRVCSRPGMEMDLAVLGGLREERENTTYQSGADYTSTERLLGLARRSDNIQAERLSHRGNTGQRSTDTEQYG